MEFIKGPVVYEKMGTMILDADNNLIVDIRGWGRFQYMEDGEKKQDEMGQFIADAINEKLTGNLKMENERLRESLRKSEDEELDSFISMMNKI